MITIFRSPFRQNITRVIEFKDATYGKKSDEMPFFSRTLELLLLIFTTYWLDLKGECSTPMVSINFAVFV